ncbi:MAG: MAPEG family protein [Deltaproteobacteria bacterium]|nr:MAPEG family protein [Deltaproteobacteria bacterium]
MSIIPALIAAVLVTVGSKAPLALAQAKTGRYDNKHPRAQQAKLEGWGARASAAHANGWEALPIFLAGGALCVATGGDGATAALIGWGWVLSRVVYTALYVQNIDKVRSLVWGLGLALALSLYVRAAL